MSLWRVVYRNDYRMIFEAATEFEARMLAAAQPYKDRTVVSCVRIKDMLAELDEDTAGREEYEDVEAELERYEQTERGSTA